VSVVVRYPVSWDSHQLLLLWEALVLAGIPDADTEAGADPAATVLAPRSPFDHEQPPVEIAPARASKEGAGWRKRGWLVATAMVTVVAGVTAGVIVTGLPRVSQFPAGRQTSSTSVGSQPTLATTPTAAERPTSGSGVDLPTSDPLPAQQFVVPRCKGCRHRTQSGECGWRGWAPHAFGCRWPQLLADALW
jgi:hypothetical protein